MTIVTLYHILGVSSDATTKEIVIAFRRRVKQWHPDVCHYPDAEERMREINEAAEILCNPILRTKYDEALARDIFTGQEDHDRAWRAQAKQSYATHSHKKNRRRSTRPATSTARTEPWVSPATIRFAAGCCAGVLVIIILSVVIITGMNMLKLSQGSSYNALLPPPLSSTSPPATYSQTIEEGDKLLEAGDYEGAVRVYDSVIAENPGQAQKEMWYNRGMAQNVLGHYQDASQSFDRVLAMAPKDSLALAQKGAALLGLGRYDDALVYTDLALEQDSDTEWIWNNRGIALTNLGQQKEARAAFDNAMVFKSKRSGF
jgi:tetratricopeptide (TPR) repeat protein